MSWDDSRWKPNQTKQNKTKRVQYPSLPLSLSLSLSLSLNFKFNFKFFIAIGLHDFQTNSTILQFPETMRTGLIRVCVLSVCDSLSLLFSLSRSLALSLSLSHSFSLSCSLAVSLTLSLSCSLAVALSLSLTLSRSLSHSLLLSRCRSLSLALSLSVVCYMHPCIPVVYISTTVSYYSEDYGPLNCTLTDTYIVSYGCLSVVLHETTFKDPNILLRIWLLKSSCDFD